MVRCGSSWGSGIIVSASGLIVTSAHIIRPYLLLQKTGEQAQEKEPTAVGDCNDCGGGAMAPLVLAPQLQAGSVVQVRLHHPPRLGAQLPPDGGRSCILPVWECGRWWPLLMLPA